MSNSVENPELMRWHPVAALAAWLVPGAGHFLVGERRRGAILFVLLFTLWNTGLLIGGISVIDRRDNTAWFVPQSLIAPSLAVDMVHQKLRQQSPMHTPNGQPTYEPSFGRVNEQGILYTGLAGLLNLLAIIDVLYHDPTRRAGERRRTKTTNDKNTPTPDRANSTTPQPKPAP